MACQLILCISNLNQEWTLKIGRYSKNTQTTVCLQRLQPNSFYRCHRSSYILNSVNKDNLINKQGEEDRFYKVTAPCPAHMRYEIKDGEFHVMYVRTHFGYCLDLKSIAISDEICKRVKDLSSTGLSDRHIVDKIRSETRGKQDTDYLITAKHVQDIITSPNEVYLS